MCDLGEKNNYTCGNTTEIVFFKQEKRNKVRQKIKTEDSEDEETGQIGDKQILPDQTEPDNVEESEAVNGCDQMYNLNYTEWKLKNEELDIKDEFETNENRESNTRSRTCNSAITDYNQESRPFICSEINNTMVNNLLQETKTTKIDVPKDLSGLSAVEGNLEGCNGQSLSSTLQIKGKHKSLLNAALMNIKNTDNSIMADFETDNVPLDVPKYSCDKDFIEQGPKLIVVIKRLNISEKNGELIIDHNPHQIPCTASNSIDEHQDCRFQIQQQRYNRVIQKLNVNVDNDLGIFRQRNLYKHGPRKGSGKVKLKCDQCDYRSIRKGDLNKHLLRHNNSGEVKLFKCDQCDYRSIRKGDLKKHLLVHTNPAKVYLFTCGQCGYRSNRKFCFKRHLLRHKDPEVVNLFKCGQCDYRSIWKTSLKRHLLRHKDKEVVNLFKCDQCDYQSIRKDALGQHCLLHMNPAKVNLFKCSQCDFRSIWKKNFKRHLIRHKDTEVVNLF